MRITDYSTIASKYDNNKIRHLIDRDDNIERLYQKSAGNFSVLDLACGTANYLRKQIECYAGYDITWTGIDRSPQMLAQAGAKLLDAQLIEGDACEIPLREEAMDYVKIRFALHHFQDKRKSISEVHRVLKPGGAVSIFNISHDYMKHWWVYKYFPAVPGLDAQRFPSCMQIFDMLRESGFTVSADINTVIKEFYFADLIEEAENRDISQLNIISDQEYEAGLAGLRKDALTRDSFTGDIAFHNFFARKAV